MYIDIQTRDVVHSIYIRSVETIDGQLWNKEIQTVTDVKDVGKTR
jgi:branched-chain amino acid transport system substrate-binding protein